MKNTFGGQQGDAWLRNRVGRITGSRIADVCSYLTRKSGDKQAGESSAKREAYLEEIITERLTGRAKDHYNNFAMQRGSQLEDDARMYYESVMRQMCAPVNFVLHEKYDFTGASPDSLVGDEGVLEIKCLLPWNHVHYVRKQEIPEEYLPQIQWEMACTNRKWCDFVMFCPDIQEPKFRFFYRRIERDEALIEHYTKEVLKFNAEVEFFFAENDAKPIAPFPVEVITEDGEVVEAGDVNDFGSEAYSFVDQIEVRP